MAEKIVKKNWLSNFMLIGEARVGQYTYRIDAQSEGSSWVYNSLNLGIDCGEKFGTVYVEAMGGYSPDRDNVIYAHGKDENGNDDFSAQIVVDWNDRFDEEILEDIGELSFITVGLEKTDSGQTYYKKFLSMYDAIAYVQEHLEDGMVVNVRGNLKYSTYSGQTQVRKNVQSIVLSKVDDSSKYAAKFTQSVLLDKDSASLKNVDKDKGVMYVDARVLDYVKEVNGVEVKGQYPYPMTFEFEMDLSNQTLCKKVVDKLFKVKNGITQITFDGEFIEGGATVTATLDDISDDIRELIGVVYTEEEALVQCSSNGNRERRMILRKPIIRLVGENKTPVLQKFEEMYEEDDLILDCMNDIDDEGAESSDESDMSWLEDL